jgi:hypothetical protein
MAVAGDATDRADYHAAQSRDGADSIHPWWALVAHDNEEQRQRAEAKGAAEHCVG